MSGWEGWGEGFSPTWSRRTLVAASWLRAADRAVNVAGRSRPRGDPSRAADPRSLGGPRAKAARDPPAGDPPSRLPVV